MNKDINKEHDYAVVSVGGSIGSSSKNYSARHRGRIIGTYETPEEAKQVAARKRKSLSKGERSYYKMTYKSVKLSQTDKKDLKESVDTTVLKNIIKESVRIVENADVDSHYLQKALKLSIDDAPDKLEAKFYKDLKDYVYQKFPDGDVSKLDVQRLAKKSSVHRKVNSDMLIDILWDDFN